jgi:ParB-like nuclease domain
VADFAPDTVDIGELRPHPRNYRAHPPDQLEHICRSIELHGFYRNVVIARDGTVLAGHGVVEAARRLGRSAVPVYRLDVAPNSTAALQVLAGDNEISRLAEIDDRALTELLRELSETDGLDALLGTGFDELSLAALALVTRPASELADFDAAGEWAGLPDFAAGDPVPSLTVKFETEDDRTKLLADLGIEHVSRAGGGWSCWWPDRPLADTTAVRFE